MHRDVFRLLVLLAVVRLLTVTVLRDSRPPVARSVRCRAGALHQNRLLRGAMVWSPAQDTYIHR